MNPVKCMIACGNCKKKTMAQEVVPLAHYRCTECQQVINVTNIPLKEWLGFQYSAYLNSIVGVIRKDHFVLLKANSKEEAAMGKLTKPQITKLKTVLITNFEAGNSIRDISQDIKNIVKVKELKVANDDGEVQYTIPPSVRSINIARTESTRVANLGALENYTDRGVMQVRWVAAMTERTCPVCIDLNGKIFDATDAELPPAHALCRCTIIPVVKT